MSALLLAGGLLAALRPSTPRAQSTPDESKEIPAAWLEEDPPELAGEVERPALGAPSARREASTRQTGTLRLTGGGKRFGEETYELVVGPDGASLKSSGVFEVRILLATVRATFSQSLTEDAALRPTAYAFHLDAPLGFGQDIQTEISADGTVVTRGETGSGFVVNPDRVFMMGTFSTYALLPLAFKAREVNGVASLDLLAFAGSPGPGHSGGGSPDEALTALTVERLGDAALRADGREIQVERYRIRSALGDSVLLAKEDEFLGFLAGAGKQTLFVYRSDYFPRGFELLDGVPDAPPGR